ncbi:MAG: hypothetical protein ACOCRC_02335 [Halodesulfurarchaeum sp.]
MNWERPYFTVVGVLLGLAGALGTLMGLTGETLEIGPALVDGPFAIWRGPVLIAAGVFLGKATANGITEREDEALVFMGSVMVWIVGGTELLGIVLGAIPGGSEVWIASPAAFLAAVGPPYPPAVLGVFLTLPAFRYAEDDVRTLLKRLFGQESE